MPRTLQSLSLDARVRVYGRVLEARRDRGSTCETIARQLDLPSSTVYNWIVGKNSPLGSIVVPILTPSPSLSYLAGAMLGDGDLVRSTSYHYQLRLRVKDQDFAEKVGSCYSSVLGRPRKVRKDGSGFYVVRVWSRILYEYLSDTRAIQKTVDRFPSEFIKGFADAEGSPAISVGQSRKSSLGFLYCHGKHRPQFAKMDQAPHEVKIWDRFSVIRGKDAPEYVGQSSVILSQDRAA